MNFFELQTRAKHKTGILILYFILAVTLIIVSINVLLFLVFNYGSQDMDQALIKYQPFFVYISLGTLIVIGLGSLFTYFKLRGGGEAVAEMVGARRISPDTNDTDEKRLVNIVEEMSIASGTPVPKLYVLDNEPGINAFVAGLRPTETVLVVTKGAMQTFNRDEMQGVVGHEYSHIFNGDMRINIRLMAILAGILMIAQFGRVLMRSTRRSRGKNSGQAALIGFGLFVIGYVGIFFGNLIKASISRQREFLADASSVQFTRNPDGIAGALWKIKQHSEGSILNNSHSDDISHFCFGEAVKHGFTSLMATHPPLEDRIRSINPRFIAITRARDLSQAKDTVTDKTEKNTNISGSGIPGVAAFAGAAISSPQIGEVVGTVNDRQLEYAKHLYHDIPPELVKAVHGMDTSECVIFALVIAAMKMSEQNTAMQTLDSIAGQSITHTTGKLVELVRSSNANIRLPLINMSVPVLKSLPENRRRNFLACLEELIKSDHRYTIFEFSLFTILEDHLAQSASAVVKEKYFRYEQVLNEINLIISIIIWVGSSDEKESTVLHKRIMKLFVKRDIDMIQKRDCKLKNVSDALHKLNALSPLLKKTVIESCADCVIHGGEILPAEAELLQALAVSMDCPMPPLVA